MHKNIVRFSELTLVRTPSACLPELSEDGEVSTRSGKVWRAIAEKGNTLVKGEDNVSACLELTHLVAGTVDGSVDIINRFNRLITLDVA